MYLLLIFLPLFSALSLLLFGRSLGRTGSKSLAILAIFFSFLCALLVFFEVVVMSYTTLVVLPFSWVSVDILDIKWVFLFDSLAAVMLVVVFFVSSLVHLYSLEYMSDDPHLIRFLASLSIFTFFMAILVTSGNFIQMFLGWEGVGLASYMLINFWFMRIQANKSAIKAMVLNRVGDWGLAVGIFFVFYFFGTVDFLAVFALSPHVLTQVVEFCGITTTIADLVSFFLFFGVIGKSAQFGLHTWLPDAMEGPTPVSALLHAATMVTAGVFLVIRCSVIFEYANNVMFLVSFLGALTAFFGASVALFQTDLKKIIAYSTCSQLGYMILACGLSLYSSALFHFFNHAFFKALLFLSAGSVIHALAGEQDIYNMGSLDVYLPFTAQMIMIGSTALASFPFLSGYYSKDWILEISNAFFYFDELLALSLISQAAVFTMLYSDSLARFVFEGDKNFPSAQLASVGESSWGIVAPLAILVFPSMFSGYIFKDMFIGFGTFVFRDSMLLLPNAAHFFESDFLSAIWRITPVVISFFINFLVVFGFDFLLRYLKFFRVLHVFLYHIKGVFTLVVDFFSLSWFYDSCVNHLFVLLFLDFCKSVTFKLLDKGVLETFGPHALANICKLYADRMSNLTTGYIFHYSFLMIFALALFIAIKLYIIFALNLQVAYLYYLLFVLFVLIFVPTNKDGN